MPLFVLTETAAGLALHKCQDKKLLSRPNLEDDVNSSQKVADMFRLKKFTPFPDVTTAAEEITTINEGKVSPILEGLLNDIKEERKASLAVADSKLGKAIKQIPGLEIKPIADKTTETLYRALRDSLPSLIPNLKPEDVQTASLGLSHSMSRHKLKFSTEKVDMMIIQAIGLLDELDKEVNMYAMRVKEWYGWHFPEMAKIINDNYAFARVVLKMGMRKQAASIDLDDILPEEIAVAVKKAAEISMGTEITQDDLETIAMLAQQVVDFKEQRDELYAYLTQRMNAIAPNLTHLVGELVGARLIAQCGSMVNLAQSPASTIQIIGAEKALFRALKTKHHTPKYGLIYHASLVGQASTSKNKGKIARMLGAKLALGARQDVHSDWGLRGERTESEPNEEEKITKAISSRAKVERVLRKLEGKPARPKDAAIAPNGQVQPAKFELKEAAKYNPNADGIGPRSLALAPATEPALNGEANGHQTSVDTDMSGLSDAEYVLHADRLTNGTAEVSSSKKRKIDEAEPSERSLKALKGKSSESLENEDKRARLAATAENGEDEDEGSRSTKKGDKKRKRKIVEIEDEEEEGEESLESKAARKAAKKARKTEKETRKAEKAARKAAKASKNNGIAK